MSELIIVLIITFGILLTPLFFIGFDFWAGNRKAKQRGERIYSDKWQRTVAISTILAQNNNTKVYEQAFTVPLDSTADCICDCNPKTAYIGNYTCNVIKLG